MSATPNEPPPAGGLRGHLTLPANPSAQLVSRRRPITFYIITPLLSVFWIIVSLIWNLLRLPIPACFLCRDVEPRTRPRPPREAQQEPTSRFNAFASLATSSRSLFNLAAPRRAPRRVLSPKVARTTPGFHPHELDNVDESDEDALDAEQEQRSREDEELGLTADEGSETEPSEADTLVDNHFGPTAHKNGKQLKERRFFSRKPKRGSSTDDELAMDLVSGSGSGSGSSTAVSATSNTTSPASSVSSKSAPKFCPKQLCARKGSLRRVKSSSASPTRPPLLATHSDPYPRHFTADPDSYLEDRRPSFTRSSTGSSSEVAPPSPVESTHSATSASLSNKQPLPAITTKKHRSATASFLKHPFRSRSPLSTSPVHSPPMSPKLEAQQARRRSIDELRVDSLNLRIGRARARSELDDSGNSSLSMNDILRP